MSSDQVKAKKYWITVTIFIIVFFIYIFGFIYRVYNKKPSFKVIINPAHGGKSATASQFDGDRYDPVIMGYTKDYKEAYNIGDISEFDVLLRLSKKIQERFDYTISSWGWKKFEALLKKYGKFSEYKAIDVNSEITKEHNYKYYEKKNKKDVNEKFRLFDYRSSGVIKKNSNGILSLINKYKPEIVVNLDFNYNSKDDKELFSINIPDILFFDYIKDKIINKDLNFEKYQDIINNWYGKTKEEKIRNVIIDTWIYFIGVIPDKSGFAPSDKFLGYGSNLLEWKNKDEKYVKHYKNKDKYPQYNIDLKDFKEKGQFFKREKYKLERYKRVEGTHKIGDNMYASEEILKYIFSILTLNNNKNIKRITKIKPVYRYNEIALYANSIVINVNLGSIFDKDIQEIYTKNLDEAADAICIGIYSICQGYSLKSDKGRYLPDGKPIDFKKYYKYRYIGSRNK